MKRGPVTEQKISEKLTEPAPVSPKYLWHAGELVEWVFNGDPLLLHE